MKKGAQCTIYGVAMQRRRWTLSCPEIESWEFVAVQFSRVKEDQFLVTLSGGPDWALILWKWDKMEPVAMTKIDPIGPKEGEIPHISFSPHDEYHIIVTGGGLYKFFSFKTNDKKFIELHSQVNNK